MTLTTQVTGERAAPMPAVLLTTAQVAERLQLPVSAVRLAIRDGRLAASLPSGRRHGYRISEEQLAAWLAKSVQPSSRP